MSAQDRPPTEEEMRAAYEQQVKQLRVQDLVVETVVSLINLAGRKAGLAPGTEDERDPQQVQLAIEGVERLLPLVEAELGPNADQVRQAVSQLKMAFAQAVGGQPGEGAPEGQAPGGPQQPPPAPGGPGAAQSSGRLWVPGQ